MQLFWIGIYDSVCNFYILLIVMIIWKYIFKIQWTLVTTTAFVRKNVAIIMNIVKNHKWAERYVRKTMIYSYFLIVHMFWILLELPHWGNSNISKIYVSVKYQIQYLCIICDKLLPLKRRFRLSQIISITNFVVVLSVGIKRVVYSAEVVNYGS